MRTRLESRLSGLTGLPHCVLTGRGATAIWLALKAFAERVPERTGVVIPVTLCTSPPAVVIHAGLTPVFCDTDPATGNLCPKALSKLLAERDDILCVLAAHLYGEPADMPAIAAACDQAGAFLIEDSAQALGADGIGTYGDVTILSFGHTKIVEAGGGGAALTHDPVLAAAMQRKADALPEKSPNVSAWAETYRSTYYAAQSVWDRSPEAKEWVGAVCRAEPGLYLYRLAEGQTGLILSALERLDAEAAGRRERAAVYDRAFAGIGTPLKRTGAGVPWRYGLMLPEQHRDAAAAVLREAGIDASCWYPSCTRFFGDRGQYPGGEAIERGILNLWVDDRADKARIERTAAIVSNVLTGAAANGGRQYG
nr:DegT/DnrJ/EryC1/StrS family aminotransferase [Hyphobacterium sp. SN044]